MLSDDLLDGFRARAERVGTDVHVVEDLGQAAVLLRAQADGREVVVAPSAADHRLLAGLGDGVRIATGEPERSADATVGVVRAELAIAETGSVLVVEDELADRLVSMLSLTLFQLVAASCVVASLDDAAGWLSRRAGAGYTALVTGSSRTADIERSLTVGVQGPEAVHVVVVG